MPRSTKNRRPNMLSISIFYIFQMKHDLVDFKNSNSKRRNFSESSQSLRIQYLSLAKIFVEAIQPEIWIYCRKKIKKKNLRRLTVTHPIRIIRYTFIVGFWRKL